ncbi:MAG: type II toxin-antitoxin system RelB/DinJ family antitoxin [Firmicutes bacterium]|nr:type II toxin-antitoxin system RelB/DinJ family antitoxin [Bacillota bacterium]
MASSLVQVRVDDELKNAATEIYETLGIDLPTAVRMFLKRSVIENGIPFSMTLPVESNAKKAVEAMKRISRQAQENGIADMSLKEINAEIAAVRAGRA